MVNKSGLMFLALATVFEWHSPADAQNAAPTWSPHGEHRSRGWGPQRQERDRAHDRPRHDFRGTASKLVSTTRSGSDPCHGLRDITIMISLWAMPRKGSLIARWCLPRLA
jgi:hypothetical protein